ncbi:MAG: leucine-rich repeat domain-containing protein [Pseudomonadota bacterium]|nr:leucine-rich repeat domain-containing protein [Pseudomonadota bacterium]
MSVWTILGGIVEITQQFVEENMPDGTTEVVISEGVESIGQCAFKGHTSLKSVVIPKSVKIIGRYVFFGCASLESVVIPEDIKIIDRWVFSGCSSLKSVVIPEGAECIRSWAFDGCTSLQSIVIPEGVDSIGMRAFKDCISLEFVEIPSSIKTIGVLAFTKCTSLKSIVVSGGVETIGNETFSYCSGLHSIVLPDQFCDADNKDHCSITENQTVIPFSVLNEWKQMNRQYLEQITPDGIRSSKYSNQVILFLYQLQNDVDFRPSWNEVLNQCSEVGVEDMLHFSAGTDLHHKLTTVVSMYTEELKTADNLIKDEIMSYLNIADLPEHEFSEVNILTSQSLFSKLCSEVQSLKVLGFFGVVALAIAVGVGYMQRHPGDKY